MIHPEGLRTGRAAFSVWITLRNPFRVRGLPRLARLYRRGYKPYTSQAERLSRRIPYRYLFRLLQKLGVRGTAIIEYRRAGRIWCLTADTRNTQFHSLYLPQYERCYEPEVAALLDILSGKNSVVYDVGSNWGHHSLYIASKLGYAGKIFAFEPDPKSFLDLQSAIIDTSLGDTIVPIRTAVSDHSGLGQLIIPDRLHSGLARISKAERGTTVSLAKLDDLSLPSPDILKVDAEGHEHAIFQGGVNLLTTSVPYVILESWRSFSQPTLTFAPLELLHSLGFRIFLPALSLSASGARLCVTGWDSQQLDATPTELTLYELEPKERFLFGDNLNLLACHGDRLSELERLFTAPMGVTNAVL